MTLSDLEDGTPFVFVANMKVTFMRLQEVEGKIACRTLGRVQQIVWGEPDDEVGVVDQLYDPATREHYVTCQGCKAELVAVPMPAWNRTAKGTEVDDADAHHFRCVVCRQRVM